MIKPDSRFDDALAKVDAMRRQVEAKKQAEQQRRQDQWRMIQTKAPDVAEFLIAINKHYGKPAAVVVRIGGDVVFSKGFLLPDR